MNEYALDLFCAIGSIGDDLIYDAENAEPKRKHGFIKFASIAACVCLAIVGAFWTLARFDFALGAKCSGSPGTAVGGAYWFHMDGKGIYRYENGKTELVLHTFFEDGWIVNDYALYYTSGHSLYVKPHDTGKSRLLYRSHDGNIFQQYADKNGDIILSLRKKTRDSIIMKYVVLDGVTGEVKAEYPDGSSLNFYTLIGDYGPYRIGDRVLERVTVTDGDGNFMYYDITENGVSILPEGYRFFMHTYATDDIFIVELSRMEDDRTEFGRYCFLILRPNGDDTFIKSVNYIDCAVGNYAFGVDWESERIVCVDLYTGESWALASDSNYDDFYYLCTDEDGKYLYSTSPWNGEHACFRIVYNGDKPAALELVDNNLSD